MAKPLVARKKNHVTALRGGIFDEPGPVVYFIGCSTNSLVKIGSTKGFRQRFIELSAASPVPLMALAILRVPDRADATRIERAVQTVFTKAGRHSHGEWFRMPHDGVNALIEKFESWGAVAVFSTVESVVLDSAEENRPPVHSVRMGDVMDVTPTTCTAF